MQGKMFYVAIKCRPTPEQQIKNGKMKCNKVACQKMSKLNYKRLLKLRLPSIVPSVL